MVCLPLIDKAPADPSTMTAMVKAQKIKTQLSNNTLEIRRNTSIDELLRKRGNINGRNWHTRNTQHCVWGCSENIDRTEIPTECPCIQHAS